MIRIKTQNVTVLPKAIFRTQSKVYGGAFLQESPTINVRVCCL